MGWGDNQRERWEGGRGVRRKATCAIITLDIP